ncbi:trypsin-like peptidase domain-containing protein [Actinacidiphila glaucinigra]|uniref:VMAP-C domain-containing protein n=1 Tax=Actinacidiphila glaucinigra TaxID=235986 RepID=UPI0033BF2A54
MPGYGVAVASGPDPRGELRQLSREATVAISGPRGTAHGVWGSGFLVAPGWVLTAAHVLFDREGRPRGTGDLGVVIAGGLVAGRAAYCLPHPAGPVPFWEERYGTRPDLALVHLLSDPLPDHPCVWLGDRPEPLFDDTAIFGCQDGPAGAVELMEMKCELTAQQGPLLTLSSGPGVAKGMSGGPLIDMERGELVGVVKSRHSTGTGVLANHFSALRELSPAHLLPGGEDLGPEPYAELMRRHDRWHADRQQPSGPARTTWADVQKRLPIHAGRWTPVDRTKALGLLAALPGPQTPDIVGRTVARALDIPERSWQPRLVGWRDGHGVLYGYPDPYRELLVFLRYLMMAAQEVRCGGDRPTAEVEHRLERLERWVLARGEDLAPEHRADLARLGPVAEPFAAVPPAARTSSAGTEGESGPPTVLVEFEPLAYGHHGDLFNWAIRLGYGEGRWRQVAADHEPYGLGFDEAVEQVRGVLGRALEGADAAGASPARLEVAVPDERLGTAAHLWEDTMGSPGAAVPRAVGSGREVVVRDVGRRGDPDPQWQDRWQRLVKARRLRGLRLPPVGARTTPGEIRAAPYNAVPVLCGAVDQGVGRDSASVALDSGFPVALWRVDGHPDLSCGPRCDGFHSRMSSLLDAPEWRHEHSSVRDLPERLRRLRAAVEEDDDGARYLGSLVLLYDDPGNPLPQLFGPSVHFPLLS